MTGLLALIGAAHALQVQIRAEPPVLTQGQTGSVSVVIVSEGRTDAQPASGRPPRLPTERGLAAEFAGQASEFGNVNGRISRVQRFEYRLSAIEDGTWTVGPVDVPLDDGTIAHSEPIRVVVNDRPSASAGGPPPEFGIDVKFDDPTLWEGQVAVLQAKFQTRLPGAQVGWRIPDWDGLQLPQQGQPTQSDYAVTDPEMGTVAVNEVRIPLVAVATGRRDQGVVAAEVTIPVGGGGLFAFARGRVEHVVSERLTVDIQPLPPAPSGFAGLVGDVEVESALDRGRKDTVAVGQSLEWTVTVRGSGALDGFELPAYAAAKTLVYDKGSDRAAAFAGDAFRGTATFRRVLVPTEPGPLALPPLTFVAFSPAKGEYVTHTVDLPQLEVVPGEPVASAIQSFGGAAPLAPAAESGPPAVELRPPYPSGRAGSPSLAPFLPALLGLAAAPGLAVLSRLGARRVAAAAKRRWAPRAADPGRASALLVDLPDDPEARWAAFDAALRRAEAEPAAAAHAEAIRALRLRLGRVRFGDERPDPTFEDDLRALVAEIEP